MKFSDIRRLKSSNAALASRPKNILRRNIRPFFASESGKRYSANVSLKGCVAKFFEISDNARFFAIKKPMISFKGAHFPKDVQYFSMSIMASLIVI
jgi:hypothetical protein